MSFWFDQKHNVLIYPSAYTSNIQQAIPEARTVNGHYLAVPRTLRNCQVLRWFQYPVPPLVTDETYDFPIKPGRTPLDTQRLQTNFSVLHPRMFNLSEPGTMKTLSSLWAYDFLRRKFPKGSFRALVIGTLSTLETGWGKEIYSNFLDTITFEILHGSQEKRIALLEKDRDVYIINHDGVGVGAHTKGKLSLDGFCKELANRKDIQVVIVDEASAYKDSATKRNRLGRLIFTDRPYLWPLTGSPTPTAPTDAFGIAKLVNNAMGKSFTNFKLDTMYQVAPNSFKWLPKKDGYEKARKLLTPAIRIPLSSVWNGPDLVPEMREVPLTDQQKKLMADLKRDFVVRVKSGEQISSANEAAVRQKFLQISLGAIYDNNHKAHTIDAAPRYSEADLIIEQTTRKVVVFVGITSIVELLHKHLSKHWTTEIINGDVSRSERSRIIRAFENDDNDLRIVVCDPQATAHGINEFVAADTALWFGTTEKAELYDQGNKRIRRPGQKYPTRAVQLVSNPLEKEIFRRLENNLTLQGALLTLIQNERF